jgi:hypothetical protein
LAGDAGLPLSAGGFSGTGLKIARACFKKSSSPHAVPPARKIAMETHNTVLFILYPPLLLSYMIVPVCAETVRYLFANASLTAIVDMNFP